MVADAIGRYDRELLRPPAEVADEFVFFTYQTRWSLSTPSARCATDKLIESVGGRARLGDVSLGELTGRRNDTAERNAALACATPEEITRMPSRELAPDVDVTRLRALQVALLAGAARERGLTADEASCLATRTWGSLSDEDVLMLTRGGSSAQDLAKRLSGIEQLRSCVTTARMKELSDRLAPEVQRELQASSTTVSGPTRG